MRFLIQYPQKYLVTGNSLVHKTHLSDQIDGLLNTIATQDSQNVMDWNIRCISSGKSLFESIALRQRKNLGNSHQSKVMCNNVLLNTFHG